MKKLLTLAVLSALASTTATAQDEWRVNLSTGNSFASDPSSGGDGTDMDLEPGSLLQLSLHKYQKGSRDGARLFYEFFYSQNNIDVSVTTDSGTGDYDTSLKAQHLQIGGTYEWAENPKVFDPYFAMTIGASQYSPDTSKSETYLSGTAALGARFWVMKNIALNIEARAIGTVFDSSSTIFCQNNSCLITLDGDLWWQQQLTFGASYSF
ncbi:outer membrane beta-barrel protein [Agaribacterium sp. ZY112]|uniref:outer membrane beta-barrel protein n=1 Tax=Agaribacterium sp. ZY112 TaxID=3233574 RepID=UPI0035266C20